ncbi:unnamed protein product, partial [Amoebophrya sp. A25]|eukprot:GSA25T00011640001.1
MDRRLAKRTRREATIHKRRREEEDSPDGSDDEMQDAEELSNRNFDISNAIFLTGGDGGSSSVQDHIGGSQRPFGSARSCDVDGRAFSRTRGGDAIVLSDGASDDSTSGTACDCSPHRRVVLENAEKVRFQFFLEELRQSEHFGNAILSKRPRGIWDLGAAYEEHVRVHWQDEGAKARFFRFWPATRSTSSESDEASHEGNLERQEKHCDVVDVEMADAHLPDAQQIRGDAVGRSQCWSSAETFLKQISFLRFLRVVVKHSCQVPGALLDPFPVLFCEEIARLAEEVSGSRATQCLDLRR